MYFTMTAQAQQQTGISGTVSSVTGEPLTGATILVEELQRGRTTDAHGRFSISGLEPGTYTIVIRYIGYTSQRHDVVIEPGEMTVLDIQLEDQAVMLQGLLVTAQRRAQNIQDVPVSMTAYSGEFLTEIGIEEFDDFSAFVPGLEISVQSPNNPGFMVRGITSDSGDSRIEPRVSVFQDGVSISKSRGSVVELFDMERVEVLKGPQGTLFGRGAQIGAVHLIQNKPVNYLTGELTLGPGNFDARYIRGFINTPIIENKLLLRVAGIYNVQDGYIRNLSGGTLNGKETLAFRTSLRYMPARNTVIDLIVNYQHDTPPGTSFKSGSYAPAGGTVDPFTFADLSRGEDLFIDRKVYGATLIVDQVLSGTLSMSSITGYREFDSYESFDADGTAAPALWFAEESKGQQFSQEFRLNYNSGDRLSGFGGVSYFWEDGYQHVPFETDERSLFVAFTPAINNAGEDVPIIPLVTHTGRVNQPFRFNPVTGELFKTFHSESYTNFGTLSVFEVFMDGTYKLTNELSVTAGLRMTYEDMTGAYEVENSETPGTLGFILGVEPNNLFAPTNGKLSDSDTYTSLVGRFAANYLLNDDTNVYASVSRGRRPNVVQVTASGTNFLKNEIVWSYETGIRGLAMDNQLQYDFNLYYYDYSNYQTSILELTEDGFINETRDSGYSTAYGFETSMQYALNRNFSVFANYGYIDARFDDEDVDGNPQDLAGNRFRLTPEHSVSGGLNAEYDFSGIGSFYIRPNISWKSKYFFEEDNDPRLVQEPFTLLNVRLGYISPNRNYEIAGFVRNALNSEYLIDAGNTANAFLIPTFIAGPPRMYGIHVTARF